MNKPITPSSDLLEDIKQLIDSGRSQIAIAVNASLTMLYWNIGQRIQVDILKGDRADYGKQIVKNLGSILSNEYGKSFAEKNLRRMIQFAEIFPDKEIVASLIRQLTWTHFIALIPIKEPLKRDFYIELCRQERWTTRTLRQKIDSMLYERTALSKKPEKLITQEIEALKDGQTTPDIVFRDPYFLDFLGLKDTYQEADLESAIMREMESFILELGQGFAFIARQKRLIIDGEDHYIDLLFFHRRLKRLVVIELKIGEFKASHKGQVELYLRWLDKYERQPGEEAPIGLILCAGKKQETVELLKMEKSGIRVAEYLTELPPKKLLESKLHQALIQARNHIDKSEK